MAIETVGVLANRRSLPALAGACKRRVVEVQRAALSGDGQDIQIRQYRDLYDYYSKDKDADLRGDAAEVSRCSRIRNWIWSHGAGLPRGKQHVGEAGFAFAAVALAGTDWGRILRGVIMVFRS